MNRKTKGIITGIVIVISIMLAAIAIVSCIVLTDPSNALYWKVYDLMYKKKIELVHDNVDDSGIEGLFLDLDKKLNLPDELYLKNEFQLHFDENGRITYIYAFFYGKNEKGKEHTYLVSYVREKNSKMIVWLDGNANTTYTPSMNMDLMFALCENHNLRRLEETVAQEDGTYRFSYAGDKKLRVQEEEAKKAAEKVEIHVGMCVTDQENGSQTYFLNEKLGWRLSIVDAAAGSRWYKLEKTENGGNTWSDCNLDPFLGNGGVADGLLFFDETYGYISMGSPSQEYAKIYFTTDGGLSFSAVDLPVDQIEADDVTEYDYMFLPKMEENKTSIALGMDVYQSGGTALFYSEDRGQTWVYDSIDIQ